MTNISTLKPYKSLLLAQTIDSSSQPILIKSILDEVQSLLELSSSKREFIEQKFETVDSSINFGYIYYTVLTPAAWTSDSDIEDLLNHLFVVIQYKNYFAFYLSETSKRGLIAKQFNSVSTLSLGTLEPISPFRLNTAFVKDDTRTLWLSATHRRTSIKADSKILAGINLRDALDPLQDQSYYFTAARSYTSIGTKKIPIGCSPRGSSIWTGLSVSWSDFLNSVIELLKQVEISSTPTESPLPVVASPVSKQLKELKSPYDMAFIPSDLDNPDMDPEERKEIELWTYNSKFKDIAIPSPEGSIINADIYLTEDKLGTITFNLEISDSGEVSWKVDGKAESESSKKDFSKALLHAKKPNWIRMWFDTGYTISDGQIYEVRHRDFPFLNFKWVDFNAYDIKYETKKEKPINPNPNGDGEFVDDVAFIGKDRTLHERRKKKDNRPYSEDDFVPDDSLFGWTLRNWPNYDGKQTPQTGWLVCDDGAMEIADFIHLGEENGMKVLTLIHVKGGKTKAISVSDYEVVASQAVKNLRSLDAINLSEGLAKKLTDFDKDEKKVGNLIWKDGVQQPNRSEFVTLLLELGSNYRRRVVVLQPSLAEPQKILAEEKGKKNPKDGNYARLKQLETLLLGVESDCRGLGAEFWVIASATDPVEH